MRRREVLREGDEARYTHNNGQKETVRVIRVHTEAEGGGYTVRIPSQNNRERSTIAERVAPLPSPSADETNDADETAARPANGIFSQMMTLRLIMSSGAGSGTARAVTTTDTERLADLTERVLGGELRRTGQRARLGYGGRVLSAGSTVGACAFGAARCTTAWPADSACE